MLTYSDNHTPENMTIHILEQGIFLVSEQKPHSLTRFYQFPCWYHIMYLIPSVWWVHISFSRIQLAGQVLSSYYPHSLLRIPTGKCGKLFCYFFSFLEDSKGSFTTVVIQNEHFLRAPCNFLRFYYTCWKPCWKNDSRWMIRGAIFAHPRTVKCYLTTHTLPEYIKSLVSQMRIFFTNGGETKTVISTLDIIPEARAHKPSEAWSCSSCGYVVLQVENGSMWLNLYWLICIRLEIAYWT